MVRAGDSVGVAVSGGADSLALLRLLEEMAGEMGIRLAVVHFNHQLRGSESDTDERFVEAVAAQRHLPFFAGRGDVAGEAKRRGWNLEDAGRRLRYAYFSSVLAAGNVNRIAVAHTADDQAETVLARLIRGTGPAGLAGIYPTHQMQRDFAASRSGADAALIRPLLGVRRRELRAYLEALGQDWREDPTNSDTQRLRARLRHQVLPLIEGELQPAAVPHLCRLAEMAREDEAFWSILVAERLNEILRREEGRMAIRCVDLLAPLPVLRGSGSDEARRAVSRRLVRGLIETLPSACRQLTAEHVDRVLRLAGAGSSGQSCDLPGVRVTRSFEWLWFDCAKASQEKRRAPSRNGECDSDWARETAPLERYSHAIELGRPGDATIVVVPEIGRRFRLKVIDWPTPEREDTREYVEGVLDRDLLQTPLVLRSWRPGDVFRPRGRQGTHKLKQFLRVGRVAVWDRAKWPVLTSHGEVVWVRGLPVAAEFAPRAGTRAGVVITEEEA